MIMTSSFFLLCFDLLDLHSGGFIKILNIILWSTDHEKVCSSCPLLVFSPSGFKVMAAHHRAKMIFIPFQVNT